MASSDFDADSVNHQDGCKCSTTLPSSQSFSILSSRFISRTNCTFAIPKETKDAQPFYNSMLNDPSKPFSLCRKPSQSPTRRRRHPPHENGGAFDPFRGGAHLPPGAALPGGEAAARASSDFSDPSNMPTVSSLPHLGKLERNISENSRTETPAGGMSANGMPPLPRIATHKLEGESLLYESFRSRPKVGQGEKTARAVIVLHSCNKAVLICRREGLAR